MGTPHVVHDMYWVCTFLQHKESSVALKMSWVIQTSGLQYSVYSTIIMTEDSMTMNMKDFFYTIKYLVQTFCSKLFRPLKLCRRFSLTRRLEYSCKKSEIHWHSSCFDLADRNYRIKLCASSVNITGNTGMYFQRQKRFYRFRNWLLRLAKKFACALLF